MAADCGYATQCYLSFDICIFHDKRDSVYLERSDSFRAAVADIKDYVKIKVFKGMRQKGSEDQLLK